MKIDRQRRSSNVEDRRGQGPSYARGRGGGNSLLVNLAMGLLFSRAGRRLLIPLILIAIAGFVFFPDQMRGLLASVQGGQGAAPMSAPRGAASDKEVDFSTAVLGSTEDVWGKLFAKAGRTYHPAAMVIYSGGTRSACGSARAAMGPFYCPGDKKVYLDVSFFTQMARQMDAPGDFAQSYVIAHEIGHHVQDEFGILASAHKRQSALGRGSAKANAIQVQVELQADCLAGVWAGQAQTLSSVTLDAGDMKEAIKAAYAVGDDTLQRKARGVVVPESFTHGSARARMRAFTQGFEGKTIASCTSGF